jgi:hypothetical protein
MSSTLYCNAAHGPVLRSLVRLLCFGKPPLAFMVFQKNQ